ncbi:MAG: lamin tail domain-containing protein [Pirellulaceae bacterium]|nr:lamin tail domain-containing protein [Planctomycetales bacterium]
MKTRRKRNGTTRLHDCRTNRHRLVQGLERLENRIVLDSTVVFSELMYNPAGDTDDSLEWIELRNQLSVNMDISDWRLAGGVDYTFPDGTIVPGRGYLVVAIDPAALLDATGLANALGPYTGNLSNAGEEIRLYNGENRLMNSVDYGDAGDWPAAADGGGVSLAKIDELRESESPSNWTFSAQIGGTPGVANFSVLPSVGKVAGAMPLVINEVSAVSPLKFVEIRNVGSTPLDVGGVEITATGPTGGTYTLPSQQIPAGGYLALLETQLGFSLVDGEKLFLYQSDSVLLDGQPITGRLRGLSTEHEFDWLFPSIATFGAENTFQFETDVVINEIMYHAQPQLAGNGQEYADSTEEWIELFNRGTTTVDLSDWEFRDAVDFTFPAGTTLGPQQYLVIASDAVALASKFPAATIIGNLSGTMSNSDERILLLDAFNNPADEVHYYERGQWSEYADGGGSSLELRNPFADNDNGAAWAASDEGSKSQWQTYTIQKVSSEPLQPLGAQYNEFIFGMLDASEILIDDIHVVLDPNTSPAEMLQNGTFEGDTIGQSPATWRLIGTHSGTVVNDPDAPGNKVLHLVANGPQQHIHDHVETTFVNNTPIRDGRTYEISFRAKWLAGNRQLNNRLYFTRLSNTFALDAPQENGTPGAQNSVFEANIGPTYENFGHFPVVPAANQPVTVSVDAEDPNTVTAMRLWWRRDGSVWTTVNMTTQDGRHYSASIPGQASRQVVQFFVEGTDSLGATSTYPAAGQDSRALYQVNDGVTNGRPIESLRVILLGSDNSRLFSTVNRMSNNYEYGTLIRSGQEVFYNVGVRQVGSRYIRPNSGYKVLLNPEHRYLGVHDSIRLDLNGISEILFKQMVNRAAGSYVSMYDDVAQLITPQHGTSTILLNLARFENIYLDEQFENGSDGTKFEQDDITYPTNPSPSPEGLKTDTGVSDQDIRYRGSDPEAYRGQLLIKNNRALDDFATMAEFARVINLSGSALAASIESVMDVDLWMRHYATQAFLGNWDTYGFRRPKNLRLYIRPSDGKVIPLFWDADLANLTEPLIYNGGASRLDDIRNLPQYTRLFWGHMWDLMNRSFNLQYVQSWASHYNSLGAGTGSLPSAINNRVNQARAQAMSTIPPIDFNITTNGGSPIVVGDTLANIAGDGWIDVREIRLAGSTQPLNVVWTDNNSWSAEVPLSLGENTVTLEAYDYEGNLISSDAINVTSTSTIPPVRDVLRISEINYNPATSADAEFIELVNTAAAGTDPIDLTGVRFTEGITFDFTGSAVTTLPAGERVLVVRNVAAFEADYGPGLNIAGVFTGALSNGGEAIRLIDADDITIHGFTYSDAWYPETDGGGFTLNVVDESQDVALWDQQVGWRPSDVPSGSPGAPDGGLIPNALVINEISNNATAANGNWIELLNTTAQPIDVGNWYLSDDDAVPKKYKFAAGTTIPPGGFLVLDENTSFGNAANPGSLIPFHLSSAGGRLVLRSADELGELRGYEETRSFRAAEVDVTQGLVLTSEDREFAVLVGDTRGAANQGPVIGPVVINEIMYNPSLGGVDFVELKNISNEAILLNNGAGRAWQFVEGINFVFPVGATIPAAGFAVVIEGTPGGDPAADIANFRSTYAVPAKANVYVYIGDINGVLDNGGEELVIARPANGVAGLVEVDEVDYDDVAPWPSVPDGTGASLTKLASDSYGNEPAVWGSGIFGGTPGRENLLRDDTPPTIPTGLIGRITDSNGLVLAWLASTDDESYVDHYNIYRDDVLVATSAVPIYMDDIVFNGNSYEYAVSAVNRDNLESARTDVVTIGSQTLTLREGVGHSGMIDAEIRSVTPDDNNGLTDTSLEVDGQDAGGELSVLLKWGAFSLPAGSQLIGASFTLNVTNPGNNYSVYQLLRPWNEGDVTWNNATAGQAWASAGATGPSDRGTLMGTFSGEAGVNTTTFSTAGLSVVRGWLQNPANNFGLIITNPGNSTDGADFDSSEVTLGANRPALTLVYIPASTPIISGDFNLDDVVNAADIEVMCQAINAGDTQSIFDLDGQSDAASHDDLDVLVQDILGTNYGDANLDGLVNNADYAIWFQNRFGEERSWALADFNCDGITDVRDYNIWNANRTPPQVQPAAAATDESANRRVRTRARIATSSAVDEIMAEVGSTRVVANTAQRLRSSVAP